MASFQIGAVLAKGLFPLVGVSGTTALRLALSQHHVARRVAPVANAAHGAGGAQPRDIRPRVGMDESVLLLALEPHTARYRRVTRVYGAAGRGDGRVASRGRFLVGRRWRRSESRPCCRSGSPRRRSRRRASRLRSPPERVGPSTSCSASKAGSRSRRHNHGARDLDRRARHRAHRSRARRRRAASPAVLPTACAVALLSSALPYSLEMFALTRLPTRTFGVLMSRRAGARRAIRTRFSGRAIDAAAMGGHRAASCSRPAGTAATSRPTWQAPLPD